MPEVHNIHEKAGWYASYEESEQGKALIICQEKKIQQLQTVLNDILGEIELIKHPIEHQPEMVLHSIMAMISSIPKVQHTEGSFKWVG